MNDLPQYNGEEEYNEAMEHHFFERKPIAPLLMSVDFYKDFNKAVKEKQMEKSFSVSYYDLERELSNNGIHYAEHWVIGEGARKLNGISVHCLFHTELKEQAVRDVLKDFDVTITYYPNQQHLFIEFKTD